MRECAVLMFCSVKAASWGCLGSVQGPVSSMRLGNSMRRRCEGWWTWELKLRKVVTGLRVPLQLVIPESVTYHSFQNTALQSIIIHKAKVIHPHNYTQNNLAIQDSPENIIHLSAAQTRWIFRSMPPGLEHPPNSPLDAKLALSQMFC